MTRALRYLREYAKYAPVFFANEPMCRWWRFPQRVHAMARAIIYARDELASCEDVWERGVRKSQMTRVAQESVLRNTAAILAVLAATAIAADVDQSARWASAQLRPEKSIALDGMVAKFQRLAQRYEAIQRLRPNGVPAPVLFCLHQRESDGNFNCHPHEGSPLQQRTRFVPKGRLPPPAEPPFSFLQSAEDAYYVCDRLDLKNWTTVQGALDAVESFNGLGYRSRGVPSPYLWAGSSVYSRGKYTGDGHFDSNAVDKQLGCVAILKRMAERGIPLKFAP